MKQFKFPVKIKIIVILLQLRVVVDAIPVMNYKYYNQTYQNSNYPYPANNASFLRQFPPASPMPPGQESKRGKAAADPIFVKVTEKYNKEYYHPWYGYEPYWLDGQWIYKDPYADPLATTTKMPLVCGDECEYIYRNVKQVCITHGRHWNQYHGCYHIPLSSLIFGALWCDAHEVDRLTHFWTVDTYCEFLNMQCEDSAYYLVHMGTCEPSTYALYKPLDAPWRVHWRVTEYGWDIEKSFKDKLKEPFTSWS